MACRDIFSVEGRLARAKKAFLERLRAQKWRNFARLFEAGLFPGDHGVPPTSVSARRIGSSAQQTPAPPRSPEGPVSRRRSSA